MGQQHCWPILLASDGCRELTRNDTWPAPENSSHNGEAKQQDSNAGSDSSVASMQFQDRGAVGLRDHEDNEDRKDGVKDQASQRSGYYLATGRVTSTLRPPLFPVSSTTRPPWAITIDCTTFRPS